MQAQYLFKAYKLENQESLHFIGGKLENGRINMNADVVFVSGHGYGSKDGEKGNGAVFYNGTSLFTYDLANMQAVDIAMWATCYSGNSNNSTGISLGQASVNAGAASSIGFPDTINVSSSKTFTDRLFKKLTEGETVSNSANYAKKGLAWLWDNARDYIIFGDGDITINRLNLKNASVPADKDVLTKFETDTSTGDWEGCLTEKNSYRYYKKINGMLTDRFYDVVYDEKGQIVDIFSSNDKAIPTTVLEFNANNARIMLIEANGTISDVVKYYVYKTINNKLVPIQLAYYDLYHEEGYTTQEVVCTNMNNGDKIDYSDVCCV